MNTTTFPGTFPDVTYGPVEGRMSPIVSRCADALVSVDALVGAERRHLYSAPCQGSGFARVRQTQWDIHVGYRPNTGLEVVLKWINLGLEVRFTGTFYNNPVCLGPGSVAVMNHRDEAQARKEFTAMGVDVDAAMAEWVSKAPPAPGLYIYAYDGTLLETLPPLAGGMGLAFWKDGRFWSVDEVRGSEAMKGMLNPQYAEDGTIVGENFDGGIQTYKQDVAGTLLAGHVTYVPKIVKTGSTYAIVTSNYETVTLLTDVTDADLGLGGTQPEPPPSDYDPLNDTLILQSQIRVSLQQVELIIARLQASRR